MVAAGGACAMYTDECGTCAGDNCCTEMDGCAAMTECGAALGDLFTCVNAANPPGVAGATGTTGEDCSNAFRTTVPNGAMGAHPDTTLTNCLQTNCATECKLQ